MHPTPAQFRASAVSDNWSAPSDVAKVIPRQTCLVKPFCLRRRENALHE
jgi:hypothetical protein